ncbi:serine phosphatase RsbU (regulator of sigma subunit) [Crossiella equi]|uniref:Serine phosphatase RsbU (Regulator of sigma subunit) n=1 Tax=Crossiella equi TaxID=130796 RepID=A0ABS5ALE5_9PSEU|nr:fused response regulator/phosphatase [Crossiella equi]MBP2477395.1 serine phosphatase RsbU (regulator of sigma subunit) [Crossiella equi]
MGDPRGDGPLTVVLVEDDRGDAFLVEELLAETGLPVHLNWARTLADALPHLRAGVHCVLLDLNLPDSEGLSGLSVVAERVPGAAILVLTGHADEHRGVQAVASGAQDYLVKGQVDAGLLAKAIRFSVERKRVEEGLRRLREAELVAQENSRLERGLLPTPLLSDPRIGCRTRYRPGRTQTLVGGDFYDLVEGEDGTLYALIGDVSGHGPDEAALGVCLRAGWRTLVLAETPPERMLPALNRKILRHPFPRLVFATVCMLVFPPDRRSVRLYLAGHPPPILLAGEETRQLPEDGAGAAIGIFEEGAWSPGEVALPESWRLLLFTDGLFEGRTGYGSQRLGEDGLVDLLRTRPDPDEPDWPDEVINEVQRLNGGPLTDDVAMLLLSFGA